jgi:tetratricopeptide (TPR) repeat protein
VFDHHYLKIAVQELYLPTEEQRRQAHAALADWYQDREVWDEQNSAELPWQLQQAGHLDALCKLLLQPWVLANLQRDRGSRETIDYWLIAKAHADGQLDELIADAVKEEIEKLKGRAEDQILLIDRIAALLDEAGLYRELLLHLRTLSLELKETTEGQTEEDILSGLYLLANAHRDMGHYDQAEPLFLRCLEALERLLGPEHPDTLTTVGNLGSLYRAKGDYEQAEAYYSRCLEVRERLLGPEHPETNDTRFGMANLLSDQGRYGESIPMRRRELAWCRQQSGDTDPGTLTSINCLAIDLREYGALEEAEALFRELLKTRQLMLEPSDCGIAEALGGLAKTLEKAGKLVEAAGIAQQALDHRLQHEGPDAWWTNRKRLDLALVLQKLGRDAEALSVLDQLQASINSFEAPCDADHQLLAEADVLFTSMGQGS